jgi:ubiquitin C-terminal hydrolase
MSWFCCGDKRKGEPVIKKPSLPATEDEASRKREKLVDSVKVSKISAESLQVERSIKGIDNLGNSCYISAAIQCLSNAKELSEYVLNGNWKNDANAVNPIGTDGQLLVQYVQLLHKLWESNSKKVINPKYFKECLDKICTTVGIVLS